MTKNFFYAAFSLVGLGLLPLHAGDWYNAMKPAGQATTIQLAQCRQIILPDQATEQEEAIARTIQPLWEKITKQPVTIVRESEANDDGGLFLGETEAATSLPQPGEDGISIGCNGNSILLRGGNGRGLLNAFYTLLNEDLGYRYYAVNAEMIPDVSEINVVARSYTPQLLLRDPYYFVSFNGDWSAANRTNAPNAFVAETLGGHLNFPGNDQVTFWHGDNYFVHTYQLLVPADQYFESHPEYFALNDKNERIRGHLCETNPETIKVATQTALHVLRDNPDKRLIDISRNDTGEICHCENCTALREKEGGSTGTMLYFATAIAAEIKTEFPDVIVTSLAYWVTREPAKSIVPADNISVRLCNDSCSWGNPFKKVRSHAYTVKNTKAWHETGNPLFIWDYNVNFSHYMAPMPNLDVIADNIRFWTENGAKGIMTQGAYQSPGGERDKLRSWVIAQLMWNPDLNEKELERDFIRGYFGPAAEEMEAYTALLERKVVLPRSGFKGGIRFEMTEENYPEDFRKESAELFRKAIAKAEAANDPELVKRLEYEMLPLLYVENRIAPTEETVAEWERIARANKVTHTFEAKPENFETTLAKFKEAVAQKK